MHAWFVATLPWEKHIMFLRQNRPRESKRIFPMLSLDISHTELRGTQIDII